MYRLLAVFFVVVVMTFCAEVRADNSRLGLDAKQMVVCIAPDAAASEGTLQLFHRDGAGQWQPDGKPWPVLFGRNGLAWGRGLHPEQAGPKKLNGDGKNPAGVFKIGMVLGYSPTLPKGAKDWPYHQVTNRDAWIDDPKLSDIATYNHLYTLPEGAPYPPWWEKEHMHLDDFAYEYLVLIEHNYENPVPDFGNEIYFHVRRGKHYRTAGCTTMELDNLVKMIKWLDPEAKPLLAEMTKADYARLWKDWNLPAPR